MLFRRDLVIVAGLMPGIKLKIFAPAVIWGLAILAASSIPFITPPSIGFKIEDKMAHFVEYFILGFLLARGFSRHGWGKGKAFLASAGISGVYGILDELYQLLIPGRQTDGLDMLADLAGSFCAAGIYIIAVRKSHGNRRP